MREQRGGEGNTSSQVSGPRSDNDSDLAISIPFGFHRTCRQICWEIPSIKKLLHTKAIVPAMNPLDVHRDSEMYLYSPYGDDSDPDNRVDRFMAALFSASKFRLDNDLTVGFWSGRDGPLRPSPPSPLSDR